MRTKKFDYLHSVDVGVIRLNLYNSSLEIMLVLREGESSPENPFAGEYALPGVVINGDQDDVSIDASFERLCASRKVGMLPKHFEQVETRGDRLRDPRCWSSTTFYLAIAPDDFVPKENQKFVSLRDVNEDKIRLPFDHNLIVRRITKRLINKSLYSSLPLKLLKEKFTIFNTVTAFSLAVERMVGDSSVRRRIDRMIKEKLVIETDEKVIPRAGRAQRLYRQIDSEQLFYFDRSLEQ
ncbi:NUDIX hydrolase [Pseudomonas syringae pv. actinidiae]|uniref:NUDIX hydrolase n=1 Tax=Pseudomonas viridiflava TaxID=33069 RepID=UPI0018E64F9C|nr:NUDIX hydrolase [Pseudomonas viridiflava]MBI6727552.1 NUDIX hydrolase [Pseudomonas viridiflava]MDU8352922.1 NUDIX hydrolase [Pseudomonas syringae pv. actinidiae]